MYLFLYSVLQREHRAALIFLCGVSAVAEVQKANYSIFPRRLEEIWIYVYLKYNIYVYTQHTNNKSNCKRFHSRANDIEKMWIFFRSVCENENVNYHRSRL